jgi:aquaporin TIP
VNLARKLVAEFIGTFTLIFVGCGSIVVAAGIHDTSLIGVAIANGFAIGVMVCALGYHSGAYFNPAITFGMLITGRIAGGLACWYWVAQLAGASVAALLVKVLLPRAATDAVHLGTPALGGGVDAFSGACLEAIFTFFLVWVVFGTAVDQRSSFKGIAGLAIGFTIAIDVLFGGPLTGAAMNPARAFGPELVGNDWSNAWVWYVGPLVGGGIAALVYHFLYLGKMAEAQSTT